MRILLATDHYPPSIGGAQRQSWLLASAMARRGHDVSVATVWHAGFRRIEGSADGVTVHRVRQIRTAIPLLTRDGKQREQAPFPDPVTILDLRRAISVCRPELIHTHGWLSFSVAAALGRRRIPLLLSARDYGYFCATRTLLNHGALCSGPEPRKCVTCASSYYGLPKGLMSVCAVAVGRPLLRRKLTGLHSVSSYVADVTSRHLLGVDRARGHTGGPLTETIPSFQDIASMDGQPDGDGVVRGYLERLPDQPFILFVGAFRRLKGLETLFEAYGRLEQPPPLVLMGTYEPDSPRRFPPGCVVIPDVPHAAIMASWDRALFGVMPSLWPEPFGSVVAEAMSRGKPVIGTRPGGHVDMLNDGTGILVPQGDVASLAEAMESLIHDPALRATLGEAARARARGFAADAVVPRYEQMYRDTIAAQRHEG